MAVVRAPRFTIIAGPNGAGKSTYGHLFVPTNVAVFNGDLVYADLVQRNPSVDPGRLVGGVASALEAARDKSVADHKDFAFETNFTSDMTMELAKYFREAGFVVNLIYMGLDDPDLALNRVNIRRSLGGHDVPEMIINENFNEGIKRVNSNMAFFDGITFIDGSSKPTVVAEYQKETKIYKLLVKNIDWFNIHFSTSLKTLSLQKPKKRKGRRM